MLAGLMVLAWVLLFLVTVAVGLWRAERDRKREEDRVERENRSMLRWVQAHPEAIIDPAPWPGES